MIKSYNVTKPGVIMPAQEPVYVLNSVSRNSSGLYCMYTPSSLCLPMVCHKDRDMQTTESEMDIFVSVNDKKHRLNIE